MRSVIRAVVALDLLACTGNTPTGSMLTLAPPTLSVSAATHVLPATSGTPELQVSASLRNGTKIRIGVAVGTECPLFVQLSPDPTGQPAGSLDASMACPPGGSVLELAPGDTAVLTRVLGADTLAAYAAGLYGVNVAVTTSTGLLGVWAGAVQLPLTTSP
jgi:hypothetical protein